MRTRLLGVTLAIVFAAGIGSAAADDEFILIGETAAQPLTPTEMGTVIGGDGTTVYAFVDFIAWDQQPPDLCMEGICAEILKGVLLPEGFRF